MTGKGQDLMTNAMLEICSCKSESDSTVLVVVVAVVVLLLSLNFGQDQPPEKRSVRELMEGPGICGSERCECPKERFESQKICPHLTLSDGVLKSRISQEAKGCEMPINRVIIMSFCCMKTD